MNDYLKIEPTRHLLGIDCNPQTGVIRVEGSSLSEDPVAFFRPLHVWLDEYIAEGNSIEMHLAINYLNTSSTKCIVDILDMLELADHRSNPVKVFWYYHEGDADEYETGKEFAEDYHMHFELCPIK